MNDLDYTVYYSRFHDCTEAHAEQVAERHARSLMPHLPLDRSAPILDIGCGYGFALRALRNLGYTNIAGLETSQQQAEQCRKAGFSVAVVEDTVAWLQAHQKQYSFILLMDVLEHIPIAPQIQFTRAMYCSLKSSGRAFVTVPNANSIIASRWRYNDHTHYSSFTEHSLFFVLRSAGFPHISISCDKGICRPSIRLWKSESRNTWRRMIVRWLWLQVYKAELSRDQIKDISLDLNLTALASKS